MFFVYPQRQHVLKYLNILSLGSPYRKGSYIKKLSIRTIRFSYTDCLVTISVKFINVLQRLRKKLQGLKEAR